MKKVLGTLISNRSMTAEEILESIGAQLVDEVQDNGNVLLDGEYYYFENISFEENDDGNMDVVYNEQ